MLLKVCSCHKQLKLYFDTRVHIEIKIKQKDVDHIEKVSDDIGVKSNVFN